MTNPAPTFSETLYEAVMHMKEAGRSVSEIAEFLVEEAEIAETGIETVEEDGTLQVLFPEEGRKIYYDRYNWHLGPA